MRYSPSLFPLLRTACALSVLLWIAGCGAPATRPPALSPYAQEAEDSDDEDDTDDSFDVASVSEPELSDMRGGFLLVGGLKLDFGLTTTTTINGNVVSNLALSSSKLTGSLPLNLQQLVQVGSGNNFNSPASASTTATVLTFVQNSTNNATIANQNILNLSVSNFNSFNLHSAAFANSLLARGFR